MSLSFSYRHLYYFWAVAKEGGLTRAAEKLGLSVQTVSTQVRELEQALGAALLKPSGRSLVLTEAGLAALEQAEQIFQIGETLPERVRDAATSPAVRLAVGISDGLPKLVAQRLLAPVLDTPQLRLLCHEDEFDDLLGDLALHRLDVVLADRPAPANPNLRVYSHSLGSSPVAWYAHERWAATARRNFPASLADVPLLLPTSHAALRPRLDHWLADQGVRPRVAGEFEDSALLATFGSEGLGVFPAATAVDDALTGRYGLVNVGLAEGVAEQFFAVGTDKKISHPLVRRLLPQAAA
ncbi:LysR family transcriptional regulator [Roseateles puraquae]|jgi:LysR family transcriptional activator of nhaA|uniref:LysR family transcriptional regulator n=1 Tax=Roseateles puraquae TaxID=431059 RepID=A0A254N0K4_9BURK|nr:LysR family transcriptional regulator [Roseateles puraquae]MDG0855421.1 LysR family transcriptional regulator [Roseateles puraquae]OWR01826.1 LysR family transcriptional regulator [Roseateles puraquae]